MSLEKKIVTPQSLLIEKTALELAASFYEEGMSRGLTSKYKTAKQYAKKNIERFIPAAVNLLMDMIGSGAIPEDQKDLIYSALMERTNDKDLSNCGIPVFKNDLPYLADKPVIYDQPIIDAIKRKAN